MNMNKCIQKLLTAAIIIQIMMLPVTAQVYIQTTLPAAGMVQKNQLWNLVLINGTNSNIDARLTLSLRDRQRNTELMTASASRFTIPRGSLPVNVNSLSPIQYNYLNMLPNNTFNDLLPAGSYMVCYRLDQLVGERQVPLAEECAPFDIEPLSPPMLLFPADSSELEVNPTQFSWIPPTPAGMLPGLRYDIFIAEIRNGQKPAEAIQENLPFYQTTNQPDNFITYPAALPAFEKEKWYCWQVVARDEKNYAGKTETWVFKINKPNGKPETVKGTSFLKMKTDAPEEGIAPDGILKISFFNRTSDREVKVLVQNLTNPKEPPATFTIDCKTGENQAELNLGRKIKITETDAGKATIVFSNGETSSVLFRVKKFKK
jgi:hypothetical protein